MNNNVLVLGYYDRANLGDEAYKLSFRKYFPNCSFTFVCVDDACNISTSKYNVLMVGGGDIINDYFNKKIKNIVENFVGIKLAVSIGIPFPCLITEQYFKQYDHVFTRNYEDLRRLQELMGCEKAHFLPDLAFVLDRPKRTVAPQEKKSCGVFLVNNMLRYPKIVKHIAKLVGQISFDHNLIFYSFNTSQSKENDSEISDVVAQHILSKYNRNASITDQHHLSDVNEMLLSMGNLDFAVCMRFHAHIFSMLANVPFISISSTRKTRSLMKYADLIDCQYEIELDGYSNPCCSNFVEMFETYNFIKNNYDNIKNKIDKFVEKCKFLLDHEQISNIITQHDIDVNDNVNIFMDKYSDDYDNASRLINNRILGYTDTELHWGIVEKMKQLKESVKYSIQYLFENRTSYILDKIMYHSKLPITLHLSEYQSLKSAHRGGWYVTIERLAKMMSSNGVYCDMFIDRTFHWCNNYMLHSGMIPYTMPWCGFIHHTADTPYSKYSTKELFKNRHFLQSLNTCTGLFTLSNTLTKEIQKLLTDSNYSNVSVYTFVHPVVEPTMTFSIEKFICNENKKLIQIGAWLRNYFTIHTITNSEQFDIERCILLGKNMGDCKFPDKFSIRTLDKYITCHESTSDSSDCDVFIPCRGEKTAIPRIVSYYINWLHDNHKITEHRYECDTLYVKLTKGVTICELDNYTNNVKYLDYLINEEYDCLFGDNIIFLHLVEAAACNVVIEAIVRNTPILINKSAGTIDLLGENYPLFYTEQHIANNNISVILTYDNIMKAHLYLTQMDKSVYEVDYFVEQMTSVADVISAVS